MTPLIFIFYSAALIILGACLYYAMDRVWKWPARPVPPTAAEKARVRRMVREVYARDIRHVMDPSGPDGPVADSSEGYGITQEEMRKEGED